MTLAEVYRAYGHQVRAVAKRLDERLLGPIDYLFREGARVGPVRVGGVEVRQFRVSRRRRALLVPLGLTSAPLVGRLRLARARRRLPMLYARVVRPALAPLLADSDLIHIVGGGLLAAASVHAAHDLGLRAVMTPLAHPDPRGFDPALTQACLAADAVFATVRADAAVYREMGVAASALHVCGLPVPPLPTEGSFGDPVPNGAPVVLFLGARRPDKGWKLLHESAPHVWGCAPEARFAFVGPGEGLPPGDERILDVGRVSDGERAAWIRRASVLCLPSAWESFGLVVAEAWSEGVPVVVSDIPVLRELVDSSGGGVIAAREPRAIADAVAGLLADPERARKLGGAGRRFWRRECDPAVVGRRHLVVYDDLIRRRGRARASAPG